MEGQMFMMVKSMTTGWLIAWNGKKNRCIDFKQHATRSGRQVKTGMIITIF